MLRAWRVFFWGGAMMVGLFLMQGSVLVAPLPAALLGNRTVDDAGDAGKLAAFEADFELALQQGMDSNFVEYQNGSGSGSGAGSSGEPGTWTYHHSENPACAGWWYSELPDLPYLCENWTIEMTARVDPGPFLRSVEVPK